MMLPTRNEYADNNHVLYSHEPSIITSTHLAFLTQRRHASVLRSIRALIYYTQRKHSDYAAFYDEGPGMRYKYFNLDYELATLVVGSDSREFNCAYLAAAIASTSLVHLIELLEVIKQNNNRIRGV